MLLFVLGIVTCAALAVYSIVEDPKLFAWVAGLLGVGLVLWFVSRAIGGPPREPEPGTAAAD